MIMIFSADRNWGIGRDNRLLFRAQGDMKRFRRLTLGKTVVMGYNTFLSLPNSTPLPGRENIVLSRKPGLQIPGAKVCGGLDSLLRETENCHDNDVFIIGGAQVYKLLMPFSNTALVTKFDAFGDADSFMENLDKSPEWRLSETSEIFKDNGCPSYTFNTYVRSV